MNQKVVPAYRLKNPSLTSLKLILKEARIVAPPDVLKLQQDIDGELATKLIAGMKKQYTKPSPFANWMVEPVHHEYREMVAADGR